MPRFPIYSPAPRLSCPRHQHPRISSILHQRSIVTTDQVSLTHCYHPESVVSIESPLGVTRFLDKSIVTGVHHYDILLSMFAALKTLCTPALHPFPPSQHLATADLFTVSIVLPFPECHRVGSSDWLLVLPYRHRRFLHVFSWPGTHFFLFFKNYLFIYLFGPCPRHAEDLGPGIEPKLQQ